MVFWPNREIEATLGTEAEWVKMSLHAPNATNAHLCRDLLPSTITVIDDEEMNFVYLQTPIGSNEFVQRAIWRKN